MAERKKYVGDAAIGRAIKSLSGKIENLRNTVSDIAVSIVEHANGAGNGDMSRALDLCKTVARSKTMNVAFLIGWFRYFGNANINLRANDGAGKVSLIARDSKAYRGGFDVDGARANNWYDAFDDNNERAPWYAGPAPTEFQSMTIGDIAADFERFAKREMDKLNGTKTIGNKVVPLVQVSEADRQQLENALDFVKRLAATLARHEEVHQLHQKLAEVEEAAKEDEVVVEVIQPKERAVA